MLNFSSSSARILQRTRLETRHMTSCHNTQTLIYGPCYLKFFLLVQQTMLILPAGLPLSGSSMLCYTRTYNRCSTLSSVSAGNSQTTKLQCYHGNSVIYEAINTHTVRENFGGGGGGSPLREFDAATLSSDIKRIIVVVFML
jgi:hypothetical protein